MKRKRLVAVWAILATALLAVVLPSTGSAGEANPWRTVQGVPHPVGTLTGQVPGLIGGGSLDLNADGRFVVDIGAGPDGYPGCANDNCRVYMVVNVETGANTPVGVAWTGAYTPNVIFQRSALSDDGNIVVYDHNGSSPASGLYARDLRQAEPVRIDVDSGGSPGNDEFSHDVAISGDGKVVAFSSRATDLAGDPGTCTLGGFAQDCSHIYVHSLETGETIRASVTSSGEDADGDSEDASLSEDGRFVSFTSRAPNLRSGAANDECQGFQTGQFIQCHDVYVHDMETGETTLASVDSNGDPGTGGSQSGSLSANGRTIAFASQAADLVSEDTNEWQDIFVRDLDAGTTERVNVTSAGAQTEDGSSNQPSISADGRRVAFWSDATTLDPDGPDQCGLFPVKCADVFVHERGFDKTYKVSVSASGEHADGRSDLPAISAGGRHVVFVSGAPNLAPEVDGATFLAERAGVAWGNLDCTRGLDAGDALLTFQASAGIEPAAPHGCPQVNAPIEITAAGIWGDVDCSGAVNPQDGIVILRYVVGLLPIPPASGPCPLLGGEVTVVEIS